MPVQSYLMHYVYVLISEKDKTVYIGETEDLKRRLAQHQSGNTPSLRSKLPVRLLYYEAYETKRQGRQRERKLKRSSWEKRRLLSRLLGSD